MRSTTPAAASRALNVLCGRSQTLAAAAASAGSSMAVPSAPFDAAAVRLVSRPQRSPLRSHASMTESSLSTCCSRRCHGRQSSGERAAVVGLHPSRQNVASTAASTAVRAGRPSGAVSARSISSCSAAAAAAYAWLHPSPPRSTGAYTMSVGAPRGQWPSARRQARLMLSMRSHVASSMGTARP